MVRKKISDCDVEAVIPYLANQRPGERRLLRIDKHFITTARLRRRGSTSGGHRLNGRIQG